MPRGKPRDPSTTFEGTPCKRGDHTLRYKKGNSCVECQRIKTSDPAYKQAALVKAAKHRANPENTIHMRYLWRRFGITPEEHKQWEAEQGGVCAICGDPPGGRWDRLHVDHAHVPGYEDMPPEEKRKHFRGLLCFECNVGLGKFKDSSDRLMAALVYLRGERAI